MEQIRTMLESFQLERFVMGALAHVLAVKPPLPVPER
jgi:hypothetical protein